MSDTTAVARIAAASRQWGRSRCRQAGTSLLEVLIAVVILSIGLLGLAGLQVAGLRVNQGAMQRSQATTLAYDVLDRMRTDRANAIGGTYDAVKTVAGKSAPLTVTELEGHASTSLQDWGAMLGRALSPVAEGMICRTNNPAAWDCAGSGSFVVVEIRWPDENDRDSGKQSIRVMGQL